MLADEPVEDDVVAEDAADADDADVEAVADAVAGAVPPGDAVAEG